MTKKLTKKALPILGALLIAIFSFWGISSALAVDDTTPPSAPTNLTAIAISSAQINLAWTASTDDVAVTGYAIFRNGAEIANVATTTFNDVGLTASTTYAYAIKAYDAAGNRSEFSSTVSTSTLATTVDTTIPSAPTNLTATAVSTSQINLAWTASTDNIAVVGYKIFRNGTQIATSTNTTFYNTGLTASTTYSYMIKAYDAADNVSADSNTASATTFAVTADTTAPSAPSNLTALVVSFSHVNLKWSTSTDNIAVVGYKVFRDGLEITTVKNAHFNDIGLTASTTYSYMVKAYDAAGNLSASSNTITITTLPNNDGTCDCDCDCDCDGHNNNENGDRKGWQEQKKFGHAFSQMNKYKNKITKSFGKNK